MKTDDLEDDDLVVVWKRRLVIEICAFYYFCYIIFFWIYEMILILINLIFIFVLNKNNNKFSVIVYGYTPMKWLEWKMILMHTRVRAKEMVVIMWEAPKDLWGKEMVVMRLCEKHQNTFGPTV